MTHTSTGSGKLVVIGGGPAGLTAAYELQKHAPDFEIDVYEASGMVGGISRTEVFKGFRLDIGGHRFFTKVPEVEEMWREVLTDDFIKVRRLSRIFYGGSSSTTRSRYSTRSAISAPTSRCAS